ncbi:MAG: SH3 domain-containing protein [Porcipelethomonas sp.]
MNCPNCGMEIEDDEKICSLCGFSFDGGADETDEPFTESISETDSNTEPVNEKKSKGIVLIVILIAVIIVLGAMIAVKFIGGSDNSNRNTVQPVAENQTETTETVITTSAVPETTAATTVTTLQTTTVTTASSAETAPKKEQATEAVKVNSDDETFSTYNGGIEYPRIHAYVRQKGNEFNIRINWSSGTTSSAVYICNGNIDGGSGWSGDMTVCTVEYEGDQVYCEIYSIEEHVLRFYPENDMIMWDGIALTKESDGAEFVIGTVKIKEGVLNVRSNTNTQSQIIGTLDKGDIVPIVEDLGDWYLILYNNSIGAVSSEFITVN